LFKDLWRELFTGDRRAVWPVLRTYAWPYLRQGRNALAPKTSDFVLDDLKPFFKNLARF
jgi:hypothetical protein